MRSEPLLIVIVIVIVIVILIWLLIWLLILGAPSNTLAGIR